MSVGEVGVREAVGTTQALGLDERVRLMRDGLINNSAFLVSGLIGIFLVPIMLRGLGPEMYGFWIAASSVAGLVANFTFAFGGSVAREVAAAHASRERIAPFIAAARNATILLGAIGTAIIVALGFAMGRSFHLSAINLRPVPLIFALLALAHLFNWLAAFEVDVLHGLRRFDVINAISIATAALQFAGIVALLRTGRGLIAIAGWYAVVSVAIACLTSGAVAYLEPQFHLRLARPQWTILRPHLSFSATSQLLTAVSVLVWRAPLVLIGALLGSPAVVPYQVGQRFPATITGVSTRAAEVFFPAASEHETDAELSTTYDMFTLGARWSLMLALPLCVVLWVEAPVLLQAWLKEVPAGSVAILRLVTGAVLVDAIAVPTWHVLWGRGASRTVLIVLSSVALLSVALALVFVLRLGVVGAAWGLLLPVAAGAIVFLELASRVCSVPLFALIRTIGRGLLWPLLFSLAATIAASRVVGQGWVGVILAALACVAGYTLGMFVGSTRKENIVLARGVLALPGDAYRGMRHALCPVGFLRSAWWHLLALREAALDSPERGRAELERTFAQEDPWRHGTNPRERQRYGGELAMLDAVRGGGRFQSALEIGCSEGLFTQLLAERCDSLLAVDISAVALERARRRREWGERVRFSEFDIRVDPLPETFDLIVVVHVLEYIRNPRYLRKARKKLVDALRPGGFLLVGSVKNEVLTERAWWSRYLLRGGKQINAFMAADPALKVVQSAEFDLADCISLDVLLQKTR